MSASGWDQFLDTGEEVLWQGQPRTGIIWRDAFGVSTLIGLFFAGFAMFWMTAASSMIGGQNVPFPFQFFPLFGVPFLLIGLHLAFGHLLLDAYRRYGTHYTLTSRQVFIAREMFGQRSLQGWALEDLSNVTLLDGAPGSVFFNPLRGGSSGQIHGARHFNQGNMAPKRLGFRLIDEAREVYGLLLRAKSDLPEAEWDR